MSSNDWSQHDPLRNERIERALNAISEVDAQSSLSDTPVTEVSGCSLIVRWLDPYERIGGLPYHISVSDYEWFASERELRELVTLLGTLLADHERD